MPPFILDDSQILPGIDGLRQDWGYGVCWMNPPYGRSIKHWISKAWEASEDGAVVVCLIPARTDTQWWHDYIWDESINAPRNGVQLRLVKGRIRFEGQKSSAPFPSVIVIFGRLTER